MVVVFVVLWDGADDLILVGVVLLLHGHAVDGVATDY